MTNPRVLLTRVLALFTRRRRDAELTDEIQAHLDRLAADHERVGLSPREARAAARREFGGVDQIKETYRDQRGLPLIDTIGQDFRYGLRQLRKNAGFATAAILTLGVGIGATTAIFSLVDVVILRPLRYQDPERLVALHEVIPNFGKAPR